MLKKLLLTVLLILFIFFSFLDLKANNLVVYNIDLLGNKRTKEHIILRELTFKQGDTIAQNLLEKYLEQSKINLRNIELFNFIDIQYIIKNKQLYITVIVEEQWYIIPYFYIHTAEGSFNTWLQTKQWNALTYGGKYRDRNFFGRKHLFAVDIAGGFDNYIDIQYVIPYLNKNTNIGLQFEAGLNMNRRIIKQILDYKIDIFRIEKLILKKGFYFLTGISFRPEHHFYLLADFSYHFDKYTDTLFQEYPNFWNNTILNYFKLKVKIKLDYRDYASYPLKGYYYDIILEKYGFDLPFETVNGLFLQTNFRAYTPLCKRLYFGAGINAFTTFNLQLPLFLEKLIGNKDMEMRALFPYLLPAKDMIMLKTNVKVEILQPKYVRIRNWDTRVGHLSFACYLNLFYDALDYRESDFYLQLKNEKSMNGFQSAIGLGFDLVTSYDKVLRLETSYGFQRKQIFYGISFKSAI